MGEANNIWVGQILDMGRADIRYGQGKCHIYVARI